MNTVAHFKSALLRRLEKAKASATAPLELCAERTQTRTWHIGARRLNPFWLHHNSPQTARHLFFDENKSIYLRCRVEKFDAALPDYLAARGEKKRKYIYRKINHTDADIIVEQAAQVLARRYEAYRDSGAMPLDLLEL